MQKEIFEQPESIKNTMRGRVDFDNSKVRGDGEEKGRRRGQVVYSNVLIKGLHVPSSHIGGGG